MSLTPKWVSKKALLLLHEESLAHFGGLRGVRDEGGFESALTRPQNLLSYKPDADIFELAACYAYGLARSQNLADGNKRIAFLSIGIFLRINGYAFKADQVDAIETVLAVAIDNINEEALAAWIRKNSVLSDKR